MMAGKTVLLVIIFRSRPGPIVIHMIAKYVFTVKKRQCLIIYLTTSTQEVVLEIWLEFMPEDIKPLRAKW